jgi:hypothetical protein
MPIARARTQEGEALGLPLTLGLAGIGSVLGGFAGHRLPLQPPPSAAPPAPRAPPRPEPADPALATLLAGGRNQVLEAVRYHIDLADRPAFLRIMVECRAVRRRSGALAWRLCEDVAHPERWVELWMVESWTDHLREQERLTESDRGEAAPEASRYLNVMPDMLR